MRIFLASVALGALAACAPQVPDSGAGVGFDRVDADRTARLERNARLEGAPPVQTSELQSTQQGDGAAIERAAAAQAQAANSGVAPLDASPENPAPQAVTNGAGISREQDFQAVSGERDIQGDAARLRQAQAQYQVIEPTALPTRQGGQPNIVGYALQTNNPVGTAVYKRSSLNSQAKHQRNCASFASPDLAQEDFLSNGGPQRDRKALDPDGDGFACAWDPTPFRRAAGG
ncbi:hypothetical protein [Phaeobacter sp. J2-8]|uniref:hypothetical protein n=1 Tax=Phaeobacter sp. J2-8 TaxID=2931394 RepID=UPI001FCF834E|nr:hypothetical protein [Phaeobacter sp. J2-8]MCJ7871868.1 hypothetical protein [Phaeobacter sp. J2-8]